MKKILFYFSCFLIAIIQVTVGPFWTMAGISPNLVLSLSLALVVLNSFEQMWLVIVALGLVTELFSGLVFGLASLSLIVVVFLIDWLQKRIFSSLNFWIIAASAFGASFIFGVLNFGLSRIFALDLSWDWRVQSVGALVNALIATIFFYGIKKIFGQTTIQRKH